MDKCCVLLSKDKMKAKTNQIKHNYRKHSVEPMTLARPNSPFFPIKPKPISNKTGLNQQDPTNQPTNNKSINLPTDQRINHKPTNETINKPTKLSTIKQTNMDENLTKSKNL